MTSRACKLFVLATAAATLPSGLHAQTLFGYDGTDNNLYSIDPSVPSATLIGNDGSSGIPSEIEAADGVVYASDTGGDNTGLHLLDPATGAVTGTISMTFPPEGNVITAMESVDGIMYAILTTEGGGQSYLSTIDLVTGDVTVVGDTGFGFPMGGLAFDGSTMYAVSSGGTTAELFTVDLGSGVAMSVGPITTAGGPIGTTALEFGPDGELYTMPIRMGFEAGILFSVDPSTGFATEVGDLGVPSMNGLTTSEPAAFNVIEVPTLSFWGFLALAGFLGWLALWKLRTLAAESRS